MASAYARVRPAHARHRMTGRFMRISGRIQADSKASAWPGSIRPSYSARPTMTPSIRVPAAARAQVDQVLRARRRRPRRSPASSTDAGQCHGLLQVEPAQHAVAADIGVDDRRHAGVLERQREVAARRSTRSRPSPRSRPCRRARRCRRRCGRERRGRPRAPAPGSSPRRCPGSRGARRRRARPRCPPCRGCRRRAAPGSSRRRGWRRPPRRSPACRRRRRSGRPRAARRSRHPARRAPGPPDRTNRPSPDPSRRGAGARTGRPSGRSPGRG